MPSSQDAKAQSYWMNRRYSSLSTCSPSSVTANRRGTGAVPSRNFSSPWLRTMSNTCCFDIRLAGDRLPLLEEPKPASGMKRILNSHDLYACKEGHIELVVFILFPYFSQPANVERSKGF